jgi:hypothetical protein
VRADLLLHEKRLILNTESGDTAVVELKVWSVSKSKDYPQGKKYSLFLVSKGEVIIGFDNHKPKGHHLHLGNNELPYMFHSLEKLINDFWDLVRKAGFKP